MHHEASDGSTVTRTYAEVAQRACGFAYYLRKHKRRRVGILCPNTPAFLEAIFGIAGASAVNVGMTLDAIHLSINSRHGQLLTDGDNRH